MPNATGGVTRVPLNAQDLPAGTLTTPDLQITSIPGLRSPTVGNYGSIPDDFCHMDGRLFTDTTDAGTVNATADTNGQSTTISAHYSGFSSLPALSGGEDYAVRWTVLDVDDPAKLVHPTTGATIDDREVPGHGTPLASGCEGSGGTLHQGRAHPTRASPEVGYRSCSG